MNASSRTYLVTGSSRGLGLAMARHLLAAGHQVIGVARSEAALDDPGYRHFRLDVADEDAVGKLFFELRRERIGLNGLINNAGVASMNAFALTPADSYDRIFNINVKGTVLFCQKALPLLRRSTAARIVNFSTVAVPLALAGEALYAASKSAVETLTRVLAREYGSYGITCNAIGPSPIDTALIAGVPRDKIEDLLRSQAIGQQASEADVLNVLDFYLRPESEMITGQVIYLGGIW